MAGLTLRIITPERVILDEINQAAEDSEKGITLKPIVRIGD